MAAADLTGANAGDNATPFQDGVGNFSKYAFGLDLGKSRFDSEVAAEGPSLPTFTASGDTLEITFLRRKNGGLTYTLQKNAGLESSGWTPVSVTPSIEAYAPNEQLERVTYEIPAPTDPATFFQVHVDL